MSRGRGNAGQAAVELAMTLPLIVAIVTTMVDIAAMSMARIHLEHTVGAAARVAAASLQPEQAVDRLLARHDEETTASIETSEDGLLVTVTLERRRRAPWSPLSLLGATTLSATATAAIEPVRGP